MTILASTIIIITLGPMIKGSKYFDNIIFMDKYKLDCSCYSDVLEEETNEVKQKIFKKIVNRCKRLKTFNVFEHLSVLVNLNFSLFCLFHGLSNKMDNIEKKLFIISIIPFVLTIMNISYSGYIFNNDYPGFEKCKDLIRYSTKYLNSHNYGENNLFSVLDSNFIKTDSDGVFAKLDQKTNKYVLLYPPEDDTDIYGPYIKYKDLGNKRYNYNKDLFFPKEDDMKKKIGYCRYSYLPDILSGSLEEKTYYIGDKEYPCDYLYIRYEKQYDYLNKNLSDRWISSIVVASLAALAELIIIIMDLSTCICNY